MSTEYTVVAQGLRHGVRVRIRSFLTNVLDTSVRCHTVCGGYVDDVLPDKGFLPVTCVCCLAAAQRYVSLQGEV